MFVSFFWYGILLIALLFVQSFLISAPSQAVKEDWVQQLSEHAGTNEEHEHDEDGEHDKTKDINNNSTTPSLSFIPPRSTTISADSITLTSSPFAYTRIRTSSAEQLPISSSSSSPGTTSLHPKPLVRRNTLNSVLGSSQLQKRLSASNLLALATNVPRSQADMDAQALSSISNMTSSSYSDANSSDSEYTSSPTYSSQAQFGKKRLWTKNAATIQVTCAYCNWNGRLEDLCLHTKECSSGCGTRTAVVAVPQRLKT